MPFSNEDPEDPLTNQTEAAGQDSERFCRIKRERTSGSDGLMDS